MSVLKIKTKLSNQKALKIILVFGRKTSRKNRMIKAKRCKTKMNLSKIAQLLKTIKKTLSYKTISICVNYQA